MVWHHPLLLWVQILPLLILFGSILAYRLERKRLGRFGDAQILGIGWQMNRRIARALLFVLGVCCVTAILANPGREIPKSSASVPRREILLDFRSSEGESAGEALSHWEDLCDAVESLVEQSSLTRFSLYRPGNPVELMIPDTLDTHGLLLVMNTSFPPRSSETSDRLQECLASLLSRPTEKRAQKLVVITSRTREEITRLWLSVQHPALMPMFMRILPEIRSVEYAIPGENGNWVWSTQPGLLRSYEQSTDDSLRRPPLWKRFSGIQLLALAAFVLLSIELVYPVFARSIAGGGRDLG